MSESLYAIYEETRRGQVLRALFPPTDAGCTAALEWGAGEFEIFHAAKSPTREVGEAYLQKHHGIHIHRETDDD